MPKITLGIQISSSSIGLVRLKGGLSRVSLSGVAKMPCDAGVVDALKSLKQWAGDTVVSSVSADNTFNRIVSVPFTERKKVEQSAPLEAEDTLPLSLEQLTYNIQTLKKDSGKSRVLFIGAPSHNIDERLELFRQANLPINVMDTDQMALVTVAAAALSSTSDVCVLDLGEDLAQAVLFDGDGNPVDFFSTDSSSGLQLVKIEFERFISLARERDNAVTSIMVTGAAAGEIEMAQWSNDFGVTVAKMPYPSSLQNGSAQASASWPEWAIPLGLALRELLPKSSSRINLLRDRLDQSSGSVAYRSIGIKAAVYCFILIVLWGIGVGIEGSNKAKQVDDLKGKVRSTFTSVLPHVSVIHDELEQLKAETLELEERASSLGSLLNREVSPLRVLREMSRRIPAGLKMEFREFDARENRVKIEGETTSFDSIDKIKAALAEYPWFSSVTVSDAKSGVARDKVLFKMSIDLGKEEGGSQ